MTDPRWAAFQAYRWMAVWPDRRPMEICVTPPVTGAEMAGWYPDAELHPLPDGQGDALPKVRAFLAKWEEAPAQPGLGL